MENSDRDSKKGLEEKLSLKLETKAIILEEIKKKFNKIKAIMVKKSVIISEHLEIEIFRDKKDYERKNQMNRDFPALPQLENFRDRKDYERINESGISSTLANTYKENEHDIKIFPEKINNPSAIQDLLATTSLILLEAKNLNLESENVEISSAMQTLINQLQGKLSRFINNPIRGILNRNINFNAKKLQISKQHVLAFLKIIEEINDLGKNTKTNKNQMDQIQSKIVLLYTMLNYSIKPKKLKIRVLEGMPANLPVIDNEKHKDVNLIDKAIAKMASEKEKMMGVSKKLFPNYKIPPNIPKSAKIPPKFNVSNPVNQGKTLNKKKVDDNKPLIVNIEPNSEDFPKNKRLSYQSLKNDSCEDLIKDSIPSRLYLNSKKSEISQEMIHNEDQELKNCSYCKKPIISSSCKMPCKHYYHPECIKDCYQSLILKMNRRTEEPTCCECHSKIPFQFFERCTFLDPSARLIISLQIYSKTQINCPVCNSECGFLMLNKKLRERDKKCGEWKSNFCTFCGIKGGHRFFCKLLKDFKRGKVDHSEYVKN